jgi:MFS family permease
MSATTAEQPLPTGALKWTIIATTLVGAFVFSLSARGTVLQSGVIVQAFALDRYKVQWITGAEGIAGLTSLLASVYLLKLFGARLVYLLGAACLTVGCLGAAVARTPWELFLEGTLRSCAGFYSIPGIVILQRCLPRHARFAYCTYLALVFGGQVTVEPLGALLTFNPSWRMLFFGLAACGTCLVLIGLFLFPDDRAGAGGSSSRRARHPRPPGPPRQHTSGGRRTGRGGPGSLGQPARPGHRLPNRPALLRLPERGRSGRHVFHSPAEGA